METAGYEVPRYGYQVPRYRHPCLDVGTVPVRGAWPWIPVPRYRNLGTRCLDVGTRCLDVGTAGLGTRCLDMGTRCLDIGTGA